MSHRSPLSVEVLRKRCDPADLPFETTEELDGLKDALGQDRGLKALRFGVKMGQPGYNLYVLGPAGLGKHELVQHVLDKLISEESPPSDWCYVNNFDDPRRPRALQLPADWGEELRRDVVRLQEDLADAIPAAFESDEYRARVQEIRSDYEEAEEARFKALHDRAAERGIALLRTPAGFAFAPMKGGEVISPEEFANLPSEERRRIETAVEELQKELAAMIQRVPQQRREMRERIRDLNEEVATSVISPRVADLKQTYQECPAVLDYLQAMQKDMVENVDAFRRSEEGPPTPGETRPEVTSLHRYQVNVLVSHGENAKAPVVYEDFPLYQNLLGRIEHQAQMGALVTDFTLIRPGALHKANGGYLILEVRKLLTQPFSWEGLKQALFSRDIRITPLGEMFSLISTVSLEPEPIPLQIKIVLLGDRLLYHLLYQLDPEFRQLFKVAADMEEDVERSPENHQLYARLIAMLARKHQLRPFSRDAVASVIEQAARIAEDGERMIVHMDELSELLQEADFLAGEGGRTTVEAVQVEAAIDARRHRHDRIHERLLENIRRQILLIDTDGEQIAQVNGLSVMDLGNVRFGQPSRITATARLGSGDVVDLEREVELGGAIHSKGVMILASYLGSRYVPEKPLSLKASLVFEQSYGMVEGDSASVAELCTLLSALARLPLKQSLAITGSVNQHGRVQAIGGVNEKVEGFFDACRLRGLTSQQGVIIPASNVQHLMLRLDVVEAISKGQFAVYAISHVDEAIELLTGLEAGERDQTGQFPQGSINQRVDARLAELAELRQAMAAAIQKGEGGAS